MSWIRERLNSQGSRRQATALGAVITVLAAGSLWWNWPRGNLPDSEVVRDFWVIEETLEPVRMPGQAVPPVTMGKDRTAVIAVYYLKENSQKTLGYMKKYSPDAKEQIEAAMKDRPSNTAALIAAEHGAMVRGIEPGSAWVIAESDAGRKVTAPPQLVGGALAQPIWPDE